MFKKVLAGAALAILAIFAVPAAANATGYTPVAPGSITVGPGGTVTVPFSGFAPNESVSFTLTGENASDATLASAVAVYETGPALVKTASATGTVSVTVTLPSNASGSYTLTATGLSSGALASVSLTVVSSGSATGATGGLPNTGAMDPTLGIWAGGGLLALGAAFVIVLTVVRRQKATN